MISNSQIAKYKVAQWHAGGVPIAVPAVCNQQVSPKQKMLLFITTSRA